MKFLRKLRKKSTRRGCQFHNGKTPKKNLEELLFRSTEFGGETGEVLDAIKKYARTKRGMVGGKGEKESIEHIKEEIGDVMICLDRVSEFFGIDIEEVTIAKFNKTSEQKGLKERF